MIIFVRTHNNYLILAHMFQEISHDSNSSQASSEECSICCELKPRKNTHRDAQRPEEICYDCWYNHILSTVSRIGYRTGDDIQSPFLHGSPVDIVSCLNSLDPPQARQIEEALFLKYTSFTKQIEKCPSESCDFVYVGQKCKWNHPDNMYNCPKCDMPLTANQNFTIKALLAAAYLLMANKCPKCEIPIQKISGCPHMTCPCGHQFCWYCYKDYQYGVRDRMYQYHNVKECAFIFFSKAVLFFICIFSLLLTFNGNATIKFCLRILGIIFSVVSRAIVLDLVIFIQVIILMTKKRRHHPSSLHQSRCKQNSALLGTLAFNIVFILFLYCLDELQFFILIMLSEVVIIGVGFGLGYAIIFSIETWFEFIA